MDSGNDETTNPSLVADCVWHELMTKALYMTYHYPNCKPRCMLRLTLGYFRLGIL